MHYSAEEEVDPSAPVPARTEWRTDTTRMGSAPDSGPEDLGGQEARLPHDATRPPT
jgi:hypothetical protein